MVVVDTLQVDLKLDTSTFKRQTSQLLKDMNGFSSAFQSSLKGANNGVNKIIKSTSKLTNTVEGSLASFDQINVITQKIAKTSSGSSSKKGSSSGKKGSASSNTMLEETAALPDVYVPALSGPLQEATGWVGQLQMAFQTFKGWLEENMPAVYALLTGAGVAALMAFATDSFIPAVTAFVSFLASSPLAAFITALAAVAAGIVTAYLNMDEFRASVQGFVEHWGECFSNIINTLSELWLAFMENIGNPLREKFAQVFSEIWENHLEPFFTQVMEFISALMECLSAFFDNIIKPIFNFLMETFGPEIVRLFGGILEQVAKVIGEVIDMGTGFMEVLTGILEFLTGVFTLDWDKAWQGLCTIVQGILDMVPQFFKDAVNVVIDYLNKLLNKVQTLFNKIRSGVNSIANIFGFDGIGEIKVPTIPRLASGGIVTQATLAIIGESGPEAVVPLNSSQSYLGSAESMAPVIYDAAMLVVSAIEKKDTTLVFDSERAAGSLYPALQKEKTRIGTTAISYR